MPFVCLFCLHESTGFPKIKFGRQQVIFFSSLHSIKLNEIWKWSCFKKWSLNYNYTMKFDDLVSFFSSGVLYILRNQNNKRYFFICKALKIHRSAFLGGHPDVYSELIRMAEDREGGRQTSRRTCWFWTLWQNIQVIISSHLASEHGES